MPRVFAGRRFSASPAAPPRKRRTERPPLPRRRRCGRREKQRVFRNGGARSVPPFRAPARYRPSLTPRPNRPHLDCSALGAGATRRPGKCGIAIGHVDEIISGELLLDFGIRAVEYLGLAVSDANATGR